MALSLCASLASGFARLIYVAEPQRHETWLVSATFSGANLTNLVPHGGCEWATVHSHPSTSTNREAPTGLSLLPTHPPLKSKPNRGFSPMSSEEKRIGGMVSSCFDDMPNKKMGVSVPEGVEVPRCWCGDHCQLKRSMDYSDTYDRRFFICVNYDHHPPKRVLYDRPLSPPPLCAYIEWLDKEQSIIDKKIVRHELEWRREVLWRRLREDKRKRWQEEQCKKEEEEHCAKEGHEAERERKRELARRAKEDGEDARRKGKYPRWTQKSLGSIVDNNNPRRHV